MKTSSGDQTEIDKGIPFEFNRQDFRFYYNASPFLPGKKLQPISTLTEVGKQYSRKAGTGVALIEIQLLDSNSRPMKGFRIGIPCRTDKDLPMDIKHLKFSRIDQTRSYQAKSNFQVSVRIENTTLDTSALHGWIELTLNQALLAWVTERFLERTKTSSMFAERKIITMRKIMRQSLALPHPAVKKVEFRGDVKSTEMSKLVYRTLEHLTKTLFGGKRCNVNEIKGLQTILCHGRCSRLVKLVPTSSQHPPQTIDFMTNELLPDHPAIDPQFVCSFRDESVHEHEKSKRKKSADWVPDSSFLFQKVRLFTHGSKVGTLSNALEKLMQINSNVFLRRITFILVITRKCTTLYCYNWNPKLFDSVASTLQEIFNEFNSTRKSLEAAPKKGNNFGEVKSKSIENASSTKKSSSILMPTIVGKSVKGSYKQAVAMSRARAASGSNASRSVMTTAKSGRSSSSASTKPPQRVMHKSTWKARNSKKPITPKKNQDTDVLRMLPPTLGKEYKSLQTSLLKRSINDINKPMAYQQLFVSWLSTIKGKQVTLATINFVLSHANLVKVQTFALIQTALEHPHQFLSYILKVMLAQDTSTVLLAKNYSIQKNKDAHLLNPTMYMMRKINLLSKKRSMIVIYEISILSHNCLGKICRCRSWSLISCNEAKNVFDPIFNNIFLTNLNIKGESFNYVCTRLRRSLRHGLKDGDLNIASTLRASFAMFPSHMQAKTQLKNWFRMYHSKIMWEEVQDFSSADEFLQYVSHFPGHYEVEIFRHGSTTCIGGKVMNSEEHEAHFFLVPCIGNEITFDLFIIVSARDNILKMDKVFLEKKSRYYCTKSVFGTIFDACKETVLSLVNMVSVDFRRDQLWVEQSDWV